MNGGRTSYNKNSSTCPYTMKVALLARAFWTTFTTSSTSLVLPSAKAKGTVGTLIEPFVAFSINVRFNVSGLPLNLSLGCRSFAAALDPCPRSWSLVLNGTGRTGSPKGGRQKDKPIREEFECILLAGERAGVPLDLDCYMRNANEVRRYGSTPVIGSKVRASHK